MKKERRRKPKQRKELYEFIEETPMFCLDCGAQWPEEASVCLQCGGGISAPGLIDNPPKTKSVKRARKGAITFTILGACAVVLIAFAILTQILKDPAGKARDVNGAPVVFSARTPPPPTPISSPVWKAESYEIDTKALALQPDQMWSHPLQVQNDWRNARLVGKFTAQGGERNDIEAIVTNEEGMIKWRKNYSYQPKAWYRSGPVTEDTVDASLPAGQSYFIFDNRLSPSANKTIRFNLRVEYERLAQP
ncbi:MAG TPA: hypothetical protein VFS27_06110 [Blastocatellia bacterium]|jgi:hypothetical protein|nr:hypothetical protein [Blastocatellia bacterium]